MIDQNFWADKKVLVTGHTGFKGSSLSVWLNSMSARVYGISLPPQNSNSLFSIDFFSKITVMTSTEKQSKQAKRALDEAKKRLSDKNTNNQKMPVEKKGRGGLEPSRYGDWEVKGIASDF